MADLNLSQEEIDALLGGVESIVNVSKDEAGSPAPAPASPAAEAAAPVPEAPASAPARVSVLDELSLDFGRELMSACIGNSHEAFSDILNVTTEFQLIGFEEHTAETLRAKFAPEPTVAVDGEIEKPLLGQMLFLMSRDFALTMGDILMGNDASAPSADMEKIYVQAIGEAMKRFGAAAIAPKVGDLLSHPFTLEFKNPRTVLTSGPADFGLRNPVLLGSWRVTAQLSPERSVPVEWHFALDAHFLTEANPINIDKHAVKPAAQAPAQAPQAQAGAAPVPGLDQSEIDALLSRVQQSIAPAAPQAPAAQAQPPQQPPFQQQQPFQQQAQPFQQQEERRERVPEPAYAHQMASAAPPQFAAAPPQFAAAPPPPGAPPYGQAPSQDPNGWQPQGPAPFQPPQAPYGQAPQAPYGASPGYGQPPYGAPPAYAQPYGAAPGMPPHPQAGAPYMAQSQQPPYDPNFPGGVPPQAGYPPQGNIYGQPYPGGPGAPPPIQPAAFQTFGHPGGGQPPQAQPVHFAPLTYTPSQGLPSNIDLLLDVPLQITVELGRTKKQIQEILELTEGSIVELDKIAGESIDLLVNNKLIAKGEVVVIDENFGIRITSIVSASERLANMR